MAGESESNCPPESCDIIVIGGGIHGVGVAQAAAAAGYRVVLVESRSLAAGTSSKSSKLIHGGLRYLESFALGLVRESLRERELLLKLAPDLVHRQTFFLPVYAHTTRRPWKMRMGLSLYALLAGLGPSVRFHQVPRRRWDSLDGLQLDGLERVFAYTDAQTDDRELTRAVMQSAIALGAGLLCPAKLVRATIESGHCQAVIQRGRQEYTIRSEVIVNAAGPWANEVLQQIKPRQTTFPVDLVQGTHLELPDGIDQGCYYLEVPSDRRAVFVMPWKGRTLLGTTEHVYTGAPQAVRPLEEEIEYLLSGYREFFPGRSPHVLDAWAGLRVLPSQEGRISGRSRETQLPVDDAKTPRLLSIFGGKLTGYRATARKVLDRLQGSLPKARPIADTAELRLKPVQREAGSIGQSQP